ncbi:endosomal/lysosomal potassium channel TMEM175-like [Patiria miniata]|uniref:Endosomal/lysosomal proton channel TMEM175 n=1 Tax=Patiria miniata TaxID=46514 RepID=A0A914ADS6_PATMI|nr:endosomal/lysosomal potassium channel TMEM175-like [Patiria miniata]XP_038061889.1 endosomal/lysosomal potassium channel TMEM175-like [Patiria miniata]XP_038061890.1 endosomal/lysosomal potassium channel TMEM175-like [Patiria miniata]
MTSEDKAPETSTEDGNHKAENGGREHLEMRGAGEDVDEDGEGSDRESSRGHRFMPIDRLNIFSDAVFATITTFMVVPLKEEVQSYDVTEDLWTSLVADWYRFLVFVISFLIVSTLWQDHVWILQKVEHVGDVGLILNVLLLLVASVIPFLAALMGDFYRYPLTSRLFGGCILTLSVVQGIMIALAFRRSKMLSDHLEGDKTKKWMSVEFLSTAGLKIVLSALSIGIAGASVPASLVLLAVAMFTDWICIIVIAVYRSRKDQSFSTGIRTHLCRRFVFEDVDIDRTQTFTDGVFIIVATLIILDITADSLVPLNGKMTEEALYEALLDKKEALLAYISTFVTIGMIWYINYSMVYYIQRLSRLLLLFNRLTLLFVSIVPLGFQLVSLFSVEEAGTNENIAVQFHCILILFTSVFQLLFWVAAHWKRDKHIASSLGGLHRKRIFCLLLVYPIASLVIFCAAFSTSVFKVNTIHAVELSIPFIFLLIKLIIELVLHKRDSQSVTRGNCVPVEIASPQVDNTDTMLWHAGESEEQKR